MQTEIKASQSSNVNGERMALKKHWEKCYMWNA